MTKGGTPIQEASLPNSVNTGIRYNNYFGGIRAAIAAGATLDELEKWINGEYAPRFMAMVFAWYETENLITQHTNAAVGRAMEKHAKRKGKK